MLSGDASQLPLAVLRVLFFEQKIYPIGLIFIRSINHRPAGPGNVLVA